MLFPYYHFHVIIQNLSDLYSVAPLLLSVHKFKWHLCLYYQYQEIKYYQDGNISIIKPLILTCIAILSVCVYDTSI